ncbi:GNAT family N-acetyltransferase [Pelagimonas varians]|uniref:Putative N-acetyltransferase YsnE n=1 Tax=Pelagimonas varians TaxID=696760 RepID=A0A238L749_9RHOB|nr:GNAT family N-acetyltransferase [Pelagimonas varians]PYG25617.1 putative acetyltransferase [Pelagimonas varians]SMX50116.1 putative N-acetyltransferase YsnE [Pelagimonas varians]
MIQDCFTIDAITGPDTAVDLVLSRHFADMRAGSPEESCHVMTSQGLRNSGALLYALRDHSGEVCAVGALKPFKDGVELKSMHTVREKRGLGYGGAVLHSLLETAKFQGAKAAWLETGTQPGFAAARAMYFSAGFEECQPFGSYTADPLSTYMVLNLS